MPFVSVWIDPSDIDDPAAERRLEKMTAALTALREGDSEAAVAILSSEASDKQLQREKAKEREFRRLYDEWHALPMPRPEFLTFAHSKRTETRV